MRFTDDEWMMILIYNPGTRLGLIEALETMQKELTGCDRNLRKWTTSLLEKLRVMNDTEFKQLELYLDFGKETEG